MPRKRRKEMSVVDDVQTLSRGYEFSDFSLSLALFPTALLLLFFVHQNYKWLNEPKKRNGNELRLMMMALVGSKGEHNATLRWWLTIEKERKKRVKRCSGANLWLVRKVNETISIHARALDCFLMSIFILLLLLKANRIMRACKRRWWDGVYTWIHKEMKC